MGIKQGVYRKLGGLGGLEGLGELGELGDSYHTKQQAGHPVVGWPAGCYE